MLHSHYTPVHWANESRKSATIMIQISYRKKHRRKKKDGRRKGEGEEGRRETMYIKLFIRFSAHSASCARNVSLKFVFGQPNTNAGAQFNGLKGRLKSYAKPRIKTALRLWAGPSGLWSPIQPYWCLSDTHNCPRPHGHFGRGCFTAVLWSLRHVTPRHAGRPRRGPPLASKVLSSAQREPNPWTYVLSPWEAWAFLFSELPRGSPPYSAYFWLTSLPLTFPLSEQDCNLSWLSDPKKIKFSRTERAHPNVHILENIFKNIPKARSYKACYYLKIRGKGNVERKKNSLSPSIIHPTSLKGDGKGRRGEETSWSLESLSELPKPFRQQVADLGIFHRCFFANLSYPSPHSTWNTLKIRLKLQN